MAPRSKLKVALLREKGIDPVKQKKLKQAKRKDQERQKRKNGDEEWESEDSDDVPELVDTAALKEGSADAAAEKAAEKKGSKADEENSEEEEEDEDEEEEEEEDEEEEEEEEEEEDDSDVPLSDIESDNDLEVPDVIPYQKLTIDNHAALTSLRKRIALPVNKVPFSVHQSLISSAPLEIPDIHDDLNRELAFYKQALEHAIEGRALLKKEGVKLDRPDDYFAEMLKDDEHMGKVKGKLMEEAERKKRSADAKKQRDLKKFGKQVQVQKLQEREKAKKDMLEKVKVLKRKRAGGDMGGEEEDGMFDVALDEQTADAPRDRKKGGKRSRESTEQSRAKRQKKDAKYGHGGKKRFSKSGDAISSGDIGDSFSHKKNKAGFGGPAGKRGKAPRPGKSKRQAGRR